jgi:hypothetical protein
MPRVIKRVPKGTSIADRIEERIARGAIRPSSQKTPFQTRKPISGATAAMNIAKGVGKTVAGAAKGVAKYSPVVQATKKAIASGKLDPRKKDFLSLVPAAAAARTASRARRRSPDSRSRLRMGGR